MWKAIIKIAWASGNKKNDIGTEIPVPFLFYLKTSGYILYYYQIYEYLFWKYAQKTYLCTANERLIWTNYKLHTAYITLHREIPPCVITSLCMYIGSADLFRFPLTRNLLPNFHPTHTRARWKIYCMMVLIRWEHRVVYVLLKKWLLCLLLYLSCLLVSV